MLEDVSERKFSSVTAAIFWFTTHNPARAKYSINTLENEAGHRPESEDFTRGHPSFVWANILQAIRYVLRDFSARERLVFNLVELGRPLGERINALEVVQRYGIPKATVYRWLSNVREELDREMRARGLLIEKTDS